MDLRDDDELVEPQPHFADATGGTSVLEANGDSAAAVGDDQQPTTPERARPARIADKRRPPRPDGAAGASSPADPIEDDAGSEASDHDSARERARTRRGRGGVRGRSSSLDSQASANDGDGDCDDVCDRNVRGGGRSIRDPMHHIYWPYMLSVYLQVSFNVLFLGFVVFVLYTFVQSVQHDINMKVIEFSSEIMNEMAACSKNYVENRCDPATRIPAIRASCDLWERCMNRDPAVVARTKISAQTLGEIVNGFVEPLSYKTMFFLSIFLFGFIAASNMAFYVARNRLPSPLSHRDAPGHIALSTTPVFELPAHSPVMVRYASHPPRIQGSAERRRGGGLGSKASLR
jgi:hypothetical protein